MKHYLVKTNADYVVIADDGETAMFANADFSNDPVLYLKETDWDYSQFQIADDREAFLNEMLYNYDAESTTYRDHDLNEIIAEYDDED